MSIDSYVPTKSDGLAMHKLRRMVALSTTLQARSGKGYQELWERCFYRDCESDNTVPFYVIDLNSGADTLLAGGDGNYLIPKGNLILLIEVGPKPGISRDNDRRLEVIDMFSGIRSDISALAAFDDTGSENGTSHLGITENTLLGVEETPRESIDTMGLRYMGVFSISWETGDN